MSATTSHVRTSAGSGARPGSGSRRGSPRPTAPLKFIGPWQNALEGAVATLCAVAAMAVVSVLALVLLDAGRYGSLGSLTTGLTAMAVGGSVSPGSDVSGDSGGMGGLAGLLGGVGTGPSVSGTADAVPLGVTLAGSVVLWVTFSWRLRAGQRQRRFTGGELAVRAAGAAGTALFVLMIVAATAHGSAKLPASASATAATAGTGGLAELLGGSGSGSGSGSGGGLGGLMGGGSGAMPALTYRVGAGSAGLGAVVWVVVVVGAGCLISRRVRLPLGGALDRMRATWAPSLSAVVRTVLVLAAVPLVALAAIGAAVGGRAGTVAGGALLFAPNAVVVFLTLGVGSPWTAGMHPVQSDSGSNPLAGLMGGAGGTGGTPGLGSGRQTDRTEHLGSLSAGGWPLWLCALVVTGILLVGCACRASRTTHPARTLPLHPYRGPLARHLGMAERFGVVTAVLLGGAAWLARASGSFGVSMFGSETGGMRGELSGSVPHAVVYGLLVGSLAGFAGSLLSTVRGERVAR
ncbi:streptophobe family protein [Streptomyces sp. NPDC004542]|uniref:streptophobe family protein n=1 Tax=Streptomyces sp. NPDC004542 TaxID=3154281 RepID=UPI0033A7A210